MVTTLNKTFFMLGKYDTYKGSTLDCTHEEFRYEPFGKYDTYKGSTPSRAFINFVKSKWEI